MKKFAKLIAISLAAVMAITMSSCNGNESTPSGSSDTPKSSDTVKSDDGGNSNTDAPSGNGETTDAAGKKIGISMPTKSLQRWNQDGDNMKTQLEAAGYEVDLQYGGDNDVPTQINQLENMISGGCSVLVIAAIDGESLTEVLGTAKSAGIPVIAYDRLIMNTDAVTYYATFDNFKVGAIQGAYIEEKLGLKTNEGPFNIELFAGDPPDNNMNFFFDGAMSVLQPYLDSGKLVCKSGQTDKLTVAIEKWKTETAQARMENLISTNNYAPNGTKLDAVLCPNDSTAQGVTNALVNSGYTKDNFPVITGQDCDIPSVKNMIAGTQSMSVFKDTRTLASQVAKMIESIVKGGEPPINDTGTYDNGTGVIPSFLCEPVFADINNYKSLLVDSGYYKESELS